MDNVADSRFSVQDECAAEVHASRNVRQAVLLWLVLGCCASAGVGATFQSVTRLFSDGSTPTEWFGS